MAHDIGQSLVNRAGNGTAIRWREPEDFGEAFERPAHDAKQLRIAEQFEL
jgi:hypothetical protein